MIKRFLEDEMGIEGWRLAVADPITNALGTVDEAKLDAFRTAVLSEAEEKLPPEIVAQGLHDVGIFLVQFGYDYMKEFLLAAAQRVD